MRHPFTSLFGAAFVLLWALVWILTIVWAFQDARRRDKSGCLVVLLVLLLPWPIGLIAWLVFRPPLRRRR